MNEHDNDDQQPMPVMLITKLIAVMIAGIVVTIVLTGLVFAVKVLAWVWNS